MTEPTNSVAILPSLESLADKARFARAIESHPLFRDRIAELQFEQKAQCDAKIDELSRQVEQLDVDEVSIRADENALDLAAAAIRDEAAKRLRALDERRLDFSSKRHSNRDRRRTLMHQIRGLQGHATSIPVGTWQVASPSWFESQVEAQKGALPSTAFPPRATEVVVYHGNTPITTVVYDRP